MELAALIEKRTGRDGSHATALDPLRLHRASCPMEPVHGVYTPSLCLIAQGRKQVVLGEELYVYDAAHFLLVAVELPVTSQVAEAAPDRPYLSLSLDIDPQEVSTLITEAGLDAEPLRTVDGVGTEGASRRGIAVGPFDAPLRDAATRLVRLLDTPRDLPVLAPLIVREILYRLLRGEQGAALRRIALREGETHGIVRALHRLKGHFAEPLRVEALAQEAHMSASAFHQHFKSVTALTPLQYQKRLRLQEARRLLLGGNVDAATAGLQVGYESASQFSREYRRLFGDPPRRDAVRLRGLSPEA